MARKEAFIKARCALVKPVGFNFNLVIELIFSFKSPPSTFSRRLILDFASKHKIPFEYLSLSIDTAESDLKTRKELFSQKISHSDQAPVRAALQGKMLILDGLEKCERNVLPTLNNLLENREINLDDGRHLVSHCRYNFLLQSTSAERLKSQGIFPCHPEFFVVALTCPVPPFKGRPLDPPLRSRFQVRYLTFPSAHELNAPEFDPRAVEFVCSVNASKIANNRRIPETNLVPLSRTLQLFPSQQAGHIFSRYYPWLQFNEGNQKQNSQLEQVFPLLKKRSPISTTPLLDSSSPSASMAPSRQLLLNAMLEDHSAGRDILICGAMGSGKSLLAREFAHRLQQPCCVFPLYRDMTSRDLLATRKIVNGNSIWTDSLLVRAALAGHVLVLDGVEKVDPSVLSVLSRLCEDRQLENPIHGGDPLVVSPKFRIVALATISGTEFKLFSPQVLAMFAIHRLPVLSTAEFGFVLSKVEGRNLKEENLLLSFAQQLNQLLPERQLSTRNCLRILKRLSASKSSSLRQQISRTLLEPFLPANQRKMIRSLLEDLKVSEHVQHSSLCEISVTNNMLTIGSVCFPRFPPKTRPELVPKVTFFDVAHHRSALQEMLLDFSIGSRNLVLIGNQGVGKNKLADRFAELLNIEREYIQLHRDSTVQTLTGSPTLMNGELVFEESPLVRACRTGRCLLVDEADKAPPEVVSILKSLVEENGEVLLGDGRRLVRTPTLGKEEEEVVIHPDFCIWILANRGGFPFQGNSFVDLVGDVFSLHVVSNPDFESELEMVSSYAPNVNKEVLKTLCACFAELRGLSDEGVISYPYSTREAVNVAKHLNLFPQDGLVEALRNVLDFDAFEDSPSSSLLFQVLHRHGIPYASHLDAQNIQGTHLGKVEKLPDLRRTGEIRISKD